MLGSIESIATDMVMRVFVDFSNLAFIRRSYDDGNNVSSVFTDFGYIYTNRSVIRNIVVFCNNFVYIYRSINFWIIAKFPLES